MAIKPYTGFYVRCKSNGKRKGRIHYLIFHQSLKTTLTEAITNTTKAITCSTKTNVNELYGSDDWKWNRVQFGWQIGATLDISKFNVGIGYALDFQ